MDARGSDGPQRHYRNKERNPLDPRWLNGICKVPTTYELIINVGTAKQIGIVP
jgi:hypothetical protein